MKPRHPANQPIVDALLEETLFPSICELYDLEVEG